jgi:adenine phosphoribosyltransferase
LQPGSVDAVVGIDARGFIFAAAAAVRLKAGFVPVRKKGKLPYQTIEQDYALEYGHATVAIHTDAIKPGSRVLLVDDLLATGGTSAAAVALVKKLGGEILEAGFLIELKFLNGREKLAGIPIRSLVTYYQLLNPGASVAAVCDRRIPHQDVPCGERRSQSAATF